VKDFDSWAFCDALSFNLFDRSPHAWDKLRVWAGRTKEFEKRTAFALLWALALHDKAAPDAPFLEGLQLIEREAGDGRNFVKKAMSMALGAVARRNRVLHAEAVAVARRLGASADPAAKWLGRQLKQ